MRRALTLAAERRVFVLVTVVAAVVLTIQFVLIGRSNAELERQVDRLEATVTLLCARGYIIDDLIVGGISLIEQRLAADLATGNLAAIAADRKFLTKYANNHVKIRRELTRRESPCSFAR